MKYEVDLPKQTKKDIIIAMKKADEKIYTPQVQKAFLVDCYYRYVEPLGAHENLDKKIKTNMRCSTCIMNVKKYFRSKLRQYEKDTTAIR